MYTGMTIKAFLATDSDDATFMYFIDSAEHLQRDSNGDWEVSDEYEKDWECVNIQDSWDVGETFRIFKDYIEKELERIHIPTKDEDPVEIDINLSIHWY